MSAPKTQPGTQSKAQTLQEPKPKIDAKSERERISQEIDGRARGVRHLLRVVFLPLIVFRKRILANSAWQFEIFAGVLLAGVAATGALVAHLYHSRQYSLESRRYEFEVMRDRRDAMIEFAREIPRQQVLLARLTNQRLWMESVSRESSGLLAGFFGGAPEYWDGRSFDQVASDSKEDLLEWSRTPSFTSVCYVAIVTFNDAAFGQQSHEFVLDPSLEIRRTDNLLESIGNLSLREYAEHVESLSQIILEMEGTLVCEEDPIRFERIRTKLDDGIRWFNHAERHESLESPQYSREDAITWAIANLVDAYDFAINAAYERALRIMSNRLGQTPG